MTGVDGLGSLSDRELRLKLLRRFWAEFLRREIKLQVTHES